MPLKFYPIDAIERAEMEPLKNGQERVGEVERHGTVCASLCCKVSCKVFCYFFFTAIDVVKCFQFQVQQSWACGVFAWTWDGGWCSGGGRHDRSSLCFQVGLLISIFSMFDVIVGSSSQEAGRVRLHQKLEIEGKTQGFVGPLSQSRGGTYLTKINFSKFYPQFLMVLYVS